MALYKNVAGQKTAVLAWDTVADAPETGDAANITSQISLDGGATAPSIDLNPTELDAVDAAGIYVFDIDQTETNCDLFIQYAQSGTANIVLEPVIIYTLPGDNTAIDVDFATIATAVWAAGVRTLTSFGTLVADITTAISAILCNVWNCARRTPTIPISLLKLMLRGEKLELYRGDTLDLPLLGLGDLTTATQLWFTVKKQLSDADSAAEIQISLTAGLEAIAGAVATTPANGSITIDDLVAGNITIALTAEEMAKLDVDFVGYWDIQKAVGVAVSTLTRGNAQVLGDATRSVA